MAEHMPPDLRRCNFFFLYDGSKVKEEDDPTRKGICYFYPEETPIDKQELLCGQLAGAGRCVSELSSSPVRVLRLRRNKFAIRMKDDFFWALGCSVDVPTVSVCELLDQIIDLFCFYNGPVRQSYQLYKREILAARWAQFLSHLQQGSTDFHLIFSSMKTIDSTNVDPLLLLKAALILQACQRCPLVLAGCILFRGRVVSTQMTPALTMKVMVHECETFSKAQRRSSASGSGSLGESVSSVPVFLTSSELHYLQSAPVDKEINALSTPCKNSQRTKPRLSRTLSDTQSTGSEPSDPGSSQSSQSPQKMSYSPSKSSNHVFSPSSELLLSSNSPLQNGKGKLEYEEDSFYHSFQTNGGDFTDNSMNSSGQEAVCVNGGAEESCRTMLDFSGVRGTDLSHEGDERRGSGHMSPPCVPGQDSDSLVPMTLYLHRVKGLVLALLVETHFLNDSDSMEEVYHSSLAALNGLEAHLRSVTPGPPGTQGPYVFAHFDCIQSTLTSNLSGRPGAAQERPFVRATSLLHSHFCNTETLQEAIIRSAGAAVYGTRSVAQETFFLQHGGSVRNSGIPNHQDSAFSLPTKARHRLLKHGINLL